MKKVYLCLMAGASIALASCSSDDLSVTGGGSDTTGGSTTVVTPTEVPSVPLDNWKSARVVLNSPATTVVSLSYTTAEEGETPIIDNYVVTEGVNNIDFSVPAHVSSVDVTYDVNGTEAKSAVALNATVEEIEGSLSNYTDSNGTVHESVDYYYYPNSSATWHEHWVKENVAGEVVDKLYYICNSDFCASSVYYNTTEIDTPYIPEIGVGEPTEIVYGTAELPSSVTNFEGKLETAPGANQGTTYHTSGVVMFDASWPTQTIFDSGHEMNDVVIDYNLESVVIAYDSLHNDEYFAQNDWKEGLTVTMHVRAVGSTIAGAVGLKLAGLKDYVDFETSYVEAYFAAGQGKQEAVPSDCSLSAKLDKDADGNPVIMIDGLQYFLSDAWKNSKYIVDDLKGQDYTYYNCERKNKLYWLTTGEDFVNRGGALYTVKVKLNGKSRAMLVGKDDAKSAALATAQVEAFKDAAQKSAYQDFFIVTTSETKNEIHLPGFAPLQDASMTGRTLEYDAAVSANPNAQGAGNIFYLGQNNAVWGVKAPMLVKHLYESTTFQGEPQYVNFIDTYPEFMDFLSSNGVTNKEWFNPSKAECDDTNLVKYW